MSIPVVRTFSSFTFGDTEFTAYAVELRNPFISKREIDVNGVYVNDKLKIIGVDGRGGVIVEEPDGHIGNLWG